MTVCAIKTAGTGEGENTPLFESIAQNILQKGYSIHPAALPLKLSEQLLAQVQSMADSNTFQSAGIGRDQDHILNNFVRTDEVRWINAQTDAEKNWLNWASELQGYLNRRLFLGLFSFESHFAHYAPGSFYKKHKDAFKGETNRILTIVVYLNPAWQLNEGGDLIIYTDDDYQDGIRVTPGFGTVVVFLSEDFPHEVLPATRDRYSIAGWFRVNSSSPERVDPPR